MAVAQGHVMHMVGACLPTCQLRLYKATLRPRLPLVSRRRGRACVAFQPSKSAPLNGLLPEDAGSQAPESLGKQSRLRSDPVRATQQSAGGQASVVGRERDGSAGAPETPARVSPNGPFPSTSSYRAASETDDVKRKDQQTLLSSSQRPSAGRMGSDTEDRPSKLPGPGENSAPAADAASRGQGLREALEFQPSSAIQSRGGWEGNGQESSLKERGTGGIRDPEEARPARLKQGETTNWWASQKNFSSHGRRPAPGRGRSQTRGRSSGRGMSPGRAGWKGDGQGPGGRSGSAQRRRGGGWQGSSLREDDGSLWEDRRRPGAGQSAGSGMMPGGLQGALPQEDGGSLWEDRRRPGGRQGEESNRRPVELQGAEQVAPPRDGIWSSWAELGERGTPAMAEDSPDEVRRQTGRQAGPRSPPAIKRSSRMPPAQPLEEEFWPAVVVTGANGNGVRAEREVDFECKRTNFAIEDAYMGFCRAAFRKKPGPPERQILAMQDFLDEMTTILDRKGPSFDAINTSTALHRLAKAVSDNRLDREFRSKFRYEALTSKLLCLVDRQVAHLRFQAVANILWSVVKLGDAGMQDTLARLHIHALDLLQAGGGRAAFRDLAQLMWALAKLGRRVDPALPEAVARTALTRLPSASPFDISMLLWGFAKLSTVPGQVSFALADGELLDACVDQLTWLLPKMVEQDVSNALWALGTLGQPLSPASLHHLCGAWAEAALAQLAAGGDDGSVPAERLQHLANIVWAYAQLRVVPGDGELLSMALARVAQQPAAFGLDELSMVVWAAAVLRHPLPPGAATALVAHLTSQRSLPDPQAVACVCWALAVLEELTSEGLSLLASSLEQSLGEASVHEQLEAPQATQLLRADEAVSGPRAVIGRDFSNRISCLPHALEMQARQLVFSSAPAGVSSPLLDSVSRSLEELGVPHSLSWRTPDALLAVDIFVPRPAPLPPLALLVDGPWHFRALPPYETMGRTVLRDRLLAARGYTVCTIAWFEWVEAEAQGEHALLEFAKTRLAQVGMILP